MKILYHHRTQSKDGQRVHIEELIHAFREQGCEVIVVEPPSASSTGFGETSPTLGWVRRMLPKAAYELLELAYSVVAYRRLRAAYLKHRPDVLYERHNLFLLSGAWLRKQFKVPYLLEVNAPLFAERRDHGGLALSRLAHSTERYAWRTADFVLPVTGVLADMVAAEGVARERLRVIPNGINVTDFSCAPSTEEAKRSLGLEGRIVLGFTGFVRTWHGLDRVVDFVGRSGPEGPTLLIVGDGPARAELETQAARMGLADRVRFTGVVHRTDIPRHIAAFDIALQPAATSYASPLKLFEYMALARAIIAPSQPNIREILTDGRDALLFNVSDHEDLARKLEMLVTNPALRSRLASAASKTLTEKNYTWSANAARVTALARQLIPRRSVAGEGQSQAEA